MTKYEIKKVIGTSKEGNQFQALQILARTDVGDYRSPYIFPSSFKPVKSPDWFNNGNGDSDLVSDSSRQSDLTDLYKDSEFTL